MVLNIQDSVIIHRTYKGHRVFHVFCVLFYDCFGNNLFLSSPRLSFRYSYISNYRMLVRVSTEHQSPSPKNSKSLKRSLSNSMQPSQRLPNVTSYPLDLSNICHAIIQQTDHSTIQSSGTWYRRTNSIFKNARIDVGLRRTQSLAPTQYGFHHNVG